MSKKVRKDRVEIQNTIEVNQEQLKGYLNERVLQVVEETLAYMSFPREHWLRIRTTNLRERINREIRRRTRVVGAFPDGNAAILWVAAQWLHISSTRWDTKMYMDVKRLENRKETAT